MKIAQIAPLWERVPPPAYGGTELIVSLLTEELVARGHEVTLFASGDSETLAKLESVHPRALRLDPAIKECGIYESLQLTNAFQRAEEFDVIHSHVGCAALPYTKFIKTPIVHTLHGIFTPDNEKLFQYAKEQPYISISKSQIEPRLGLNYLATVYNAIDIKNHRFYPESEQPPYLVFLGRISPEKGTHHAIEISRKSGIPLKIAGKIDVVDVEYYEQEIKPQIDGTHIQYLGEANHTEKNELMGRALATLFPITWREPFGLVMIESMVSGTPVIAMRMGSTVEVIQDGKTGYLCDSIEDCVEAVHKVHQLDRMDCHDHVAANFSVQRMADGYEAAYRQVMQAKASSNGNGHKRSVQLAS
jgi:glycosyltransferase involved in cell wall biosynthesis